MPNQASKKKLRLGLAFLFILSGLLSWAAWRPYQIYQHRQGLERAYEMIQADNDVEIEIYGISIRTQQQYSRWEGLIANIAGLSTNPGERYDYHLDALVELGYFTHRKFQFENIRGGTPNARKIWLLANEEKN